MSRARNLADLLDASGDVKSGSLDNVPASDDASALTTGTLPVGRVPYIGRKNLIINSDMRVAQRGTSQTGITSGNNILLDRWKFKVTSSGTWTQEQDSDVPTGEGFAYSWKASCTTADTSLGSSSQLRIIYIPEALDMTHLMYGTANAKTTTLTFWVKSSKTGTYTLTAEATHGGGRYYQTTYSVSTADTWEKKTITITGDTDTGETYNSNNSGFYSLSWWMAAGSSINGSGVSQDAWVTDADYSDLAGGQTVNLADSTSNEFYITGVQLEVGTVATPHEHISYNEELALCQRYYQQNGRGHGVWTASSEFRVIINHVAAMRATPSVNLINTSGYHEKWNTDGYNGISSINFSSTGVNASDVRFVSSSNRGRTYGDPAIVERNVISISAEL